MIRKTSSVYFKRLGGKGDYQFNIKRYWCGVGVQKWPPGYTGVQKRSINFGFGYLSWRIYPVTQEDIQ